MTGTILLRNIGKLYYRRGSHSGISLKESILTGFRGHARERFWALRNIDLSIQPGLAVGVVGKNGAGKSTLLRLIGGVGKPDEGELKVRGRIGALLDLGAGFTDELTGRENVFVTGVIAGMLRSEVARRFDEIVSFAELSDVIDEPIRTYSTGMRMRLAFAVAAHINPDILLIDEALSVGDAAFQRKCLTRISEIKASGCTILLVSHDPSQIRALCDQALFLKRGKVEAFGETAEVMRLFEPPAIADKQVTPVDAHDVQLDSGTILRHDVNRFGSLIVEIRDVRILDGTGRRTHTLLTGAGLTIEVSYYAKIPVQNAHVSVGIHLPDGAACFDTNNEISGLQLSTLQGSGTVALEIDRLDLVGGQYFVVVGFYEEDWQSLYDYHWLAYPLEVVGSGTGKGILSPPSRWSLDAHDRET